MKQESVQFRYLEPVESADIPENPLPTRGTPPYFFVGETSEGGYFIKAQRTPNGGLIRAEKGWIRKKPRFKAVTE